MSNTLINLIGYNLSIFPFIYFLNNFLMPKYKCMHTWVYGFFILNIATAMTLIPSLRTYTLVKSIFLLGGLYLCVILLYNGKKLKKIIAPIILVLMLLLIEIPLDFYLIHFVRIDMNFVRQSELALLGIQVIYNFGLFLAYVLLIRILKKNIFIFQEPKLFFLIIMLLLIQVLSISKVHTVYIYDGSRKDGFIFVLACFFVTILLFIRILYYLKRLYHRTKKEYLINKTELEYQKLLDEYLNADEEMYQYLRHDLMNYMLHNDINRKGEENETSN